MVWWDQQTQAAVLLVLLVQILRQSRSGTDLVSSSKGDLEPLKMTGGASNCPKLSQCCLNRETVYSNLTVLSPLMDRNSSNRC
uniref:Secreted protein n=1 Tax=Rhizophora mucronata TaxID=61149 RepID=A0A2P2QI44_RHIMU